MMPEPSEGLAPVMVQHFETRAQSEKDGSQFCWSAKLYSALAIADRVYILENRKGGGTRHQRMKSRAIQLRSPAYLG